MPELEHKEEQLNIENIFGNPPRAILYWGITLLSIFMFSCFVIAAFIKYPNKLMMSGVINSEIPPISLICRTTGIVDSIFFSDKMPVQVGDKIMQIKSTLNDADFRRLTDFFKKFEHIGQISNYLLFECPENLELGILHDRYTLLLQRFQQFQHLLKDNSVFVKINSLHSEISQFERLNNSLNKQENLYEKDFSLTQKDYFRSQSLQKDGVIADIDKEKTESKWLNENRQLENFKTNKITNDVRKQQLITQINDLKSERARAVSNAQFEIKQLINDLKGRYFEWTDQHILKAPTTGFLTFTTAWNRNMLAREGDTLCTILPNVSSVEFVVKGNLNIKNSGTVEIGQRAVIEIQNYPSAQFGTLTGSVKDISLLPSGDSYSVTINLPSDLVTSYNKTLPKKQAMKAAITIYTKEYSLLQRLFQNILPQRE